MRVAYDFAATIIVALAIVGSIARANAASEAIVGRAEIIDGDTIAVAGTKERIRLYGIDAPEGRQTCDDAEGKMYLCGSSSAEALAAIIGQNGRVSCREQDRDRYGRIVATCVIGDVDINAEMVRLGWALEFPKYSDGRYGSTQAAAKAGAQGLWKGSFVPAWDWRKGERQTQHSPSARTATGCEIKGNISDNGRIFHVPGQDHYLRTKIDESRGERWFCTESEALSAGWRKAE